jgi:hypothetical protein
MVLEVVVSVTSVSQGVSVGSAPVVVAVSVGITGVLVGATEVVVLVVVGVTGVLLGRVGMLEVGEEPPQHSWQPPSHPMMMI